MVSVMPMLHMAAAVVLLGHLLYWALAGREVREWVTLPQESLLQRRIARRSRCVAWVSLGVLSVTGFLMLAKWHVSWQMLASGRFIATRFGLLVTVKLLAVTVIVVLLSVAAPAPGKLMLAGVAMSVIVVLVSILLLR